MNGPGVRGELREVGVATAVLAVAPLFVLGSQYFQRVLVHLLLFALFALALNLVFGHTDQLFLFVGGLAGIGAYTTALLADWTGLTAWLTLLVAGLVAGAIGAAVSWVSAKRRFTVVLISILTLNLQLVFTEAFVGARDITGGSTGFPYGYFSLEVVADPLGVSAVLVLYYLVLALLLAALAGYVWLVDGRYGLAFDAIREDELAAASVGIDVVRYKTLAGLGAAALIGVTGAFYARESAYILPGSFSFLAVDVIVLIILIVGGLRTTLGPVVGAAVVVGIEQFLGRTFTNWRTAVFGALLIVLFLYFRSGIVVAVRERLADGDLAIPDWVPRGGG